jgi:hypothetical protein
MQRFVVNTVERRHNVALAEYCEGNISIGKLAESLGGDPLTARRYLKEQGIRQIVQKADEIMSDTANA